MTADKLCGAAAAYLMIGSFWAALYGLVDIVYPNSFSGLDVAHGSDLVDFLYFSYTVLTSTGFGDIVPKSRQARAICNVEQITGALPLPTNALSTTIQLTSPRASSTGDFVFDLTGAANLSIEVQASDDLKQWTAFLTTTVTTSPQSITIPADKTKNHLFFRVQQQ